MKRKVKEYFKTPFNSTFLISSAFALVVLLILISFSKSNSKNPNESKEVLQATNTRAIIVDHNSVALFEQIPQSYLEAAGNVRVMFSDRSVGQNINEYLDCLTATSWGASSSSCRRDYYNSNWNWKTYAEKDRLVGSVPARILFNPDPVKYDRSNWKFEFRMGDYSSLTKDFIQTLAPQYLNSKDVLMYQFSYLNVTDTEKINDPVNGYWGNSERFYDINDYENFISRYTNIKFPFWTTSLARNIGTQTSARFNDTMRQYALNNNKILFDVADILSYTDSGVPCFDNRDGVPYVSQQGQYENNPDDGVNYPAVCQDYTTEADGGHLGSVSAGGLRLAKAFWVMMAQIAGWAPLGEAYPTNVNLPPSEPTSTPTEIVLPSVYFTATPTPTRVPTATLTPTVQTGANVHVGDLDGKVNIVNGGWQARVEVYVHNSNHATVAGAVVSGWMASAPTITVTCTTNNTGWCPVFTPLRLSDSVTNDTFTLTGVALSGYSYAPQYNHDVDGSTNGYTATVSK